MGLKKRSGRDGKGHQTRVPEVRGALPANLERVLGDVTDYLLVVAVDLSLFETAH